MRSPFKLRISITYTLYETVSIKNHTIYKNALSKLLEGIFVCIYLKVSILSRLICQLKFAGQFLILRFHLI